MRYYKGDDRLDLSEGLYDIVANVEPFFLSLFACSHRSHVTFNQVVSFCANVNEPSPFLPDDAFKLMGDIIEASLFFVET